jgi:hypothetical protein
MGQDTGREDLRPHLRDEPAPDGGVIVVRGGPTSVEKLRDHGQRTHRAFAVDGEPIWGISVFCALDDIGPASLEGLFRRFASYRVVHLPHVGELVAAGLDLLPSFGRPHYTLRLRGDVNLDLGRLLKALGPAEPNPYHGGRRPGRR